jgi:Fibronectin type III domain
MAEEEAAAAHQGLSKLTRKVGPFPVWVWGILLAGAIYLVRRRMGAAAGQQTDPAGNVGTIDPATGYVYGSQQDQAAMAAHNSTSTDTSSPSASTVGGQYADNSSWGRAAVNYLVGLGEDPTAANEAIQQYLGSQQLTPQQQAMVNLAIQGIGAPPQLPGPTGTPPPPVTTPPGGIVYATNPPTGLVVTGHTSSTISVKWNATTNATGYTLRYGRDSNTTDGSVAVGSGTTTATAAGLSPGTLYFLRVQATPAKAVDAFASTTASTDKTSGGSTPPPAGGSHGTYVVKSGDSLIGIANHLHIKDWHTLYNENKAVIEAAARAHGHSSSNNGSLIYPGTTLHY